MYFVPINFVNNLSWMGVGMLGVFIVIVAIIGSVYGLNYAINAFLAKKNSRDEQ